jgi:hypothetical protein
MSHKISKVRLYSEDASTPLRDGVAKQKTGELFEQLLTELHIKEDLDLDVDGNAKLTVKSGTTGKPVRYNDSAEIQRLCQQIVAVRTRTLLATRVAPGRLTSSRFRDDTFRKRPGNASIIDSDGEEGKRRSSGRGSNSNGSSHRHSRSNSRERQLTEGLAKQREDYESQLTAERDKTNQQRTRADVLESEKQQAAQQRRSDDERAASRFQEIEASRAAAVELAERLRKELQQVGGQNKERGSQLADLQQRLDVAAQQHLADEDKLRQADKALREADRQAKLKLSQLDSERLAALSKAEQFESRAGELFKRLQEVEGTAAPLKSALSKAEATRDALRRQLEEEQTLAKQGGANKDQAYTQLEKRYKEASELCAQLEPKLKAAVAEIAQLKEAAQQNARDLDKAQRAARKFESELTQLKQQHQQAGEQALRRLAELEAAVQEKESARAALKQELDALRQSAGKDQQAQASRISELQSQKVAVEQRAAQLAEQLEKVSTEAREAGQLRSKLAEKTHAEQTTHATIRSQEQQIRQTKEEARAAQEKLETQHRTALERAGASASLAYRERDAAQKQLAEERTQWQTERLTHQRALEELEALRKRFASLEQEHGQCGAKVFKPVIASPAYQEVVEVKKIPPPAQQLQRPELDAATKLKMVQSGNLAIFLENKDPELAKTAMAEVMKGFANERANADEIYYLAIFVARQDGESAQALVKPLQAWLLKRAGSPQFSRPEEQTKLNALFGALAKWNESLPKVIAAGFVSLRESRELRQKIGDLSETQLLKFATDCMGNSKNRAERLFADDLRHQLREMDKSAASLEVPGTSDKYTFERQLKENPQYTVAITSKLTANREAWRAARDTREKQLVEKIKSYRDIQTWQRILEKENPEPTEPPTPPMLEPCSQAQLKELGNAEQIEGFLIERIARLTGLTMPSSPAEIHQCAARLISRALTGKMPAFIQRALEQHEGREALLLAQLVYMHTALKNQRSGFSKSAQHGEWEWLTGHEPKEAARKLLLLTNEFAEDRNFRGSVLTSDQVRWAKSLHSLYTKASGTHIYAEAGMGKTANAQFMMRLLPKMYIPARTVHYVSPFADTVEGMNCIQVTNFNADIQIRAQTLNDIVLIDEAHLFSFNARILLQKDNDVREVQPLYMTATPVIPNDDHRGFKIEQMKVFERQLTDIRKHLAEKNTQLTGKVKSAEWDSARAAYKTLQEQADTHADTYKVYLKLPQRPYLMKRIRELGEQIVAGENEKIQENIKDLRAKFAEIDQHFASKESSSKTNSVKKIPYPKDLRSFKGAFEALAKQLQTPVDKNAVAPELRKEIAHLARLEAQISAKLEKWENEGLTRPPTENEVYIGNLPNLRKAQFNNMKYFQDKPYEFNGQAVAQQFKKLTKTDKPMDTIQLIFPGVLMDEEALQQLIGHFANVINNPSKKPVRFVYQDSHSSPDKRFGQSTIPVRGNKWVLELGTDSQMTAIPLNLFLASKHEPGITVMIYDRTNLQGGDYAALSQASLEHPIDQFIFYNFSNVKEFNLAAVSENDAYQAMRRSRGKTVLPRTRVIALDPTPQQFLEGLAKRQKMLESMWAAKYAAHKIARKLLKVLLLKNNLKWGSTLKGKRLEQLQLDLIQSDQRFKQLLEKVNLPDVIQEWLITPSQHAALVEPLLKEAGVMAHVKDEPVDNGEYVWHARKKLQELERYIKWARSYNPAVK